jgi:predicted transcriptional regulator
MGAKSVKETAMECLRALPENATWDDVQYGIYVQQSIAKGITDIDAGRVHSHEEIKKMFNVR